MRKLMILFTNILWLQVIPPTGVISATIFEDTQPTYPLIEILQLSPSQTQKIKNTDPALYSKIIEISNGLEANKSQLASLIQADPMDELEILRLTNLSHFALRTLKAAETKILIPIRVELSEQQNQALEDFQKERMNAFPQMTRKGITTILTDAGKGISLTITEPQILKQSKPAYTEDARRNRISGIVVLSVRVRKDGTVDNFQVIRSLGYGLDESAIKTIAQKWKFAPGTVNGRPVDRLAQIEVSFQIYKGP